MGDYATLLKIITDYFREYKAYDLPDVCKKYGIECDSNLEPMASKRLYWESLFLPMEHMRDIFNLAGIVRPAILVNGTVVGWWNLKNRKLQITLFSPADQKLIYDTATGLWNDLKGIEVLP